MSGQKKSLREFLKRANKISNIICNIVKNLISINKTDTNNVKVILPRLELILELILSVMSALLTFVSETILWAILFLYPAKLFQLKIFMNFCFLWKFLN
jgi:phage-related protein